ncbi:MAG: HAMP domain-containing histidine kinase [Sulfurovum sp.]|nr:HAMP domain-containing histidine kinase [Sulfurovum sp.]
MKRYEKESLVKNFLVFFSLLEILLVLLFLELYHSYKTEYKQSLYKSMQVCSYTMNCSQFTFDFSPKNNHQLNELYDDNGLYAFFTIPKSEKFNLKISYSKQNFDEDMQIEINNFWLKFIAATVVLLGISMFFTFYSLRPIRDALQLNDEFIKDILHDFNTPITAMVLNIRMFKEEKGEDPYIQRISNSINTIMLLQNNLKSFLRHSPSHNQKVDIGHLAKQRLNNMSNIYPKITYTFRKDNDLICLTNKELLTRILDNILSNAGKYNKAKGTVELSIVGDTIHIIDTGKGIKSIEKVTQRYYKEQDRGIGLGLHIVEKLSNELNIKITIDSQVNRGTQFMLDLSDLSKEEE